jgi:hypothetical protein
MNAKAARIAWRLVAHCRKVAGVVLARSETRRVFRMVNRLVPGLRTQVRRLVPARQPAPDPPDPNENYIFRPAEPSACGSEVVTVESLHQLSRLL